MSERKLNKLIRSLASRLGDGDVKGFEGAFRDAASVELLAAAREQKILTKGDADTRAAAATIVLREARRLLAADRAAEFERYVSLSTRISTAREHLGLKLSEALKRIPKLSVGQLVHVAERTFEHILEQSTHAEMNEAASVAENERRLHAASGYANDVMFAVLRALNEASRSAGPRPLKRPDALQKARPNFVQATIVAGLINSLDYVLDSTSFGDFLVAEVDEAGGQFKLDFADIRLALIRQLGIRRTLMHVLTGHRQPRFVREQLANVHPALVHAALDDFLLATNAPFPDDEEIKKLESDAEKILRQVDAEDDLLFCAAGDTPRTAVLYHMSAAMRWSALAARLVASKLPGKARRQFGCEVQLEPLLEGFVRTEEREAARAAWEELTVSLPASGHFDLARRPFASIGRDVARPILFAVGGTWATVVREIVNKGGETGQRCGAVWEEFLTRSFDKTQWRVIGRNIHIADRGRKLTEVDLLLLRGDLLLVVEMKGLTGSGLGPYDHFKTRKAIEKGCRQAKLAADHLKQHPDKIVSIAGKKVAARIQHIQPIVLTNESLLDGWEHEGVPVVGETTRKAITVGTKVDYYEGHSLKVVRTEWHVREDELCTETILAALRSPIELKLAPERGAVRHVKVSTAGLEFLVPDLVPTPAESSGNEAVSAETRIGATEYG